MIKNLSISTKLFTVILVNLLIITFLLVTYSVNTIKNMTAENIAKYEKEIIEEKKEKLKEHVDMAKAVLQIYKNKVTNETTEQELIQIKNEAIKALDSMVYGDNHGYIFVWSYDGVPLALNPRPHLIGKNLLNKQDGEGRFIVKEHIDNAKKGGGHFHQYKWKTTKDSAYETKISYSFGDNDWRWLVGTGEYLAKEEKLVAQKREVVVQNTDQLISQTIINASILLLITFLIFFYSIRIIILTPLNNLSKGLSSFFNILQNKSTTIKPIEVVSNDEIGKMSKNINDNMQLSVKSHELLQELNQQLKIEKERFELAVSGAKYGVFDWDIVTNDVYLSPRWKSILGYKDSELSNQFSTWNDNVHPDDLPKVMSIIEEYLEDKIKSFNTLFRMQHKDGNWVWIEASAKLSRDHNGNPTRMVGFHSDVTELIEYRQLLEKKVEKRTKKIKKQKEEFEAIFQYANDGLAIVGLDTKFIECNRAFLEFTGYDKDEIVTKTCGELTVEEDRDKNDIAIQTAMDQGFVTNVEKSCNTKNGQIITVNMSITLLPDKKRLLIVIHDTSHVKLMQEQTKMASLGEMIGNIAHQWRQPLSIISTSASGMKIQKELDMLSNEEFNKYCDSIDHSAQYLSQTIDDFKNFIKGESTQVLFNLSGNIESFLQLVEGSIKSNHIVIVKDIDETISLDSYPNELIQCYINIFNNSKDAMKDTKGKKYFFISLSDRDEFIEVSFKDNGGGIPLDVLPHIFEPYYTTKHQYQGTGLGLSMTYNMIVKGLQGTIEAKNVNYNFDGHFYNGAEFIIKLPKELKKG